MSNLPTNYTDDTVMMGNHPAAHNSTNAAVNNIKGGSNRFVSVANSTFVANNKIFHFFGANNYPLIQNNYTRAQLDSFFSYCKQDGVNVIRTWCFNRNVPATASTGNFLYLNGATITYNETTYQALDLVLDRARSAGVKVILVLQDNYGGQKGEWARWNNVINGTSYNTSVGDDFHTDSNLTQYFKNYINTLVPRVNTINGRNYSSDDTIFSWEMINEGRYTGNNGAIAETGQNTISSSRLTAMTNWFTTIATYIKSIDSNHMVGTGGISQYFDYVNNDPVHNGTYYGLDYDLQHQISTIDYYSAHLYPYGDSPSFGLRAYGASLGYSGTVASSGGFLAQLQEFITDAKNSSKPVTIGEYGLDKRNTLITDPYLAYPRSTHFNNVLTDWFKRGGDGFMVWHYTNLFDDNNYNIKPDGVHTGGNANSNSNDDDSGLRAIFPDFVSAAGVTANLVDLTSAQTISGAKTFDVTQFVKNDFAFTFKDSTNTNNNSIKTGTDGTLLLDVGTNNSVKVKGGDSIGVERFGYTDASFNYIWQADTLGNTTQSGKVTATKLNTATSTPASASAAGTAGDWAWDSSYIYICTATNTWKRVAIATW